MAIKESQRQKRKNIKADPSDKEWTALEREFILNYVRMRNGARSLRACSGYEGSYENAATMASQMLARPHLRAYIDERNKALVKRYELSEEAVIAELMRVAHTNVGDFLIVNDEGLPQIDLTGVAAEDLAGIAGVEVHTYWEGTGEMAREVKRVTLRQGDKTGALQMLGKKLKMFTDRVEGSITVDIASSIQEARKRRRAAHDGGGKTADDDS